MGEPGQHHRSLAERHLRELRDDSAITPDVLAEQGYRTVTDPRELLELSFDDYQCLTPGILFPLLGVDGTNGRYAFKPDHPRLRDGKSVKYEFQPRVRPIIDVPRRCLQDLRNSTVPLLSTEGGKKAACAAGLGYCALDLWGVHSWYSNPEHGGFATIAPLPDWDAITPTLNSRLCYLAFDSDSASKPSVALALRRLASFLSEHGGLVYIVHLPDEPDGSKNGLDDYVARYGAEAFAKLVANAEPWGSAGTVRKLEQELIDLRAVVSAQAAVLRNPDLTSTQKIVGIVTINDSGWRASVDQTAPYRVRATRLAAAAGMAPHTVSSALKVLCADDGIFSKQVTREFSQETGWRSAMFLTPRAGGDVLSLLRATARYSPERQPAPPKRRPRCPTHLYADVHQRWSTACMQCGQVLAEREQVLKVQKRISENEPEDGGLPSLLRTTKDVFPHSGPCPRCGRPWKFHGEADVSGICAERGPPHSARPPDP